MLLSIFDQSIESEDTWRDEIVWFKQIEILKIKE